MKVFLGGTGNGSAWMDNLIALLTIDYFNPVVADWTPECIAEEIRQRGQCDFMLYVITPKMTGTYAIAEVVDDSNKRPERTIFIPLREDDGLVFSDAQWRSLQAVARIISVNGGKVFYDLAEAATFLNSQS